MACKIARSRRGLLYLLLMTYLCPGGPNPLYAVPIVLIVSVLERKTSVSKIDRPVRDIIVHVVINRGSYYPFVLYIYFNTLLIDGGTMWLTLKGRVKTYRHARCVPAATRIFWAPRGQIDL